MLTFTQRQPPNTPTIVNITLSLTAEERTRSRYKFILADGQEILLRLPRGTILNDGDILIDENHSIYMKIIAKPEPVLTAYAEIPLLLRAAYHLEIVMYLWKLLPLIYACLQMQFYRLC